MAFTSSCCLNISGPSPSSNPYVTPKPPQVAWKKNEGSWRKHCVLGMACMILGSEMSNLAIAEEYMSLAAESKSKGVKWSDKRMCPPWRVNSLETIVPENLPRPSARRRFEKVDYSKNAPAVKLAIRSTTSCFSL